MESNTDYSRLRYLAIDRILSKDDLIRPGNSLSQHLKKKLSEKDVLTPKKAQKIEELERNLTNENLVRLVSVSSLFDDYTPVSFDTVFDYKTLENIEHCDITVSHIIHLRNYYLDQFPLGHHCELFVKCKPNVPELFNLLPVDSYDSIKIGICNQADWPEIKSKLTKHRLEFKKRYGKTPYES